MIGVKQTDLARLGDISELMWGWVDDVCAPDGGIGESGIRDVPYRPVEFGFQKCIRKAGGGVLTRKRKDSGR